MNNLCKTLMLSGSITALVMGVSAGTAFGQGQSPGDVEQVEVSASRITIAGYQQPTPVTVIGAATLERDAHVDIGDSIRELPSVGASDSPNNGSHSGNASQGDAGLDTINLRNLGLLRTLVLFDGQRMVMSNPQSGEGGYDLSTIPTTLISRVDVVTGGASAAWGSDAVAGVVNLVINKSYTGIKGNLSFGDSYKDDHRAFKGELTFGTDFAGNRGHFILAGTYTMSPDGVFANQRNWFQGQTALFNGPAGGPARITVGHIGSSKVTQGGLITASAAGTTAAANALKGIQFVGPNATPVPFNFGTVSSFTSVCTNCSATLLTDTHNANLIAVPYHNITLFNYVSYRLTDSITASLQLNFGQNAEQSYSNNGRATTYTIKADNAFIPTSVAAQMAAGGIPNFTLGSDFTNNRDPNNITVTGPNGFVTTTGQNLVQNTRQFSREVFTLSGNFGLLGQDWSWNAYAQHSAVRERETLPYNTLNGGPASGIYNRVNNAIDAVYVTPANVGTSGLGLGTIACRAQTFDPSISATQRANSTGCEPLDLFGTGVTSQAALNYIAPGRINSTLEDRALFLMNQTVFSVSAQGVLPWGLPAGKIAVAFGGEHRLESQRQTGDALGLGGDAGLGGLWASGNFVSWAGHYYVDEGFLEVDAPLLKDQFVQSLDFNMAGRLTNYSSSGTVETWKLGLTSQVNNDIRLRSTLSADIRAPSVPELFAPQNFSTSPFTDFRTGTTVAIHTSSGGNPNLLPEQATTVSGGVVLTPHWIDNLSLSFDWYSITIHKAIFATGVTSILQQCAAHVAVFCSATFFANGPTLSSTGTALSEIDGNGVVNNGIPLFSADYAGALNFVEQLSLNAASETTSGLDFQGDYRMELFNGTLDWHLLGNYNDERTRTALGVTTDAAGQLDGNDAPTGFAAQPKFRTTLAVSYGEGPYEFTVQGRYIGSARLVNNWVTGVDVDNNHVPAVAYLDLRASYRYNDAVQLYGAVDNTFNTSPPNIPNTTGYGGTGTFGPNVVTYDGLGRSFRIGVRFAD